MVDQPEALRLADALDQAAAVGNELRRLHEENDMLRARELHWRTVHDIEVARCDKYQAVMQQAREAMEVNWHTVADNAPHQDVMDFNAAITALREQLGK